jgi:hypothetical protein
VAGLILGPLLRFASAAEATIWVETDAACEAEVRAGGRSYRCRTFRVGNHHYALVRVAGLEPGEAYEYEVFLGGEKRWPEEGSAFPPSVIRTPPAGEPLKLVFGSCRICAPHEPPHTLSSEKEERGLGVDALHSMATRLRDEIPEDRPHALVMLGDQVYAHKPPRETVEFIRSRRDTSQTPGEVVADFEEYAHLYHVAWGEPTTRWLLSTVPSAMIFDDHEVDDDWNISEAWLEEMRSQPWWDAQIIGGYASYWLYQHLGNLSPAALEKDELYAKVVSSEDAWPVLSEFAYRTHREPEGIRWSFHRDLGNVRLVMMDSRGGRVLEEGRRSMTGDEEWRWIESQATGDFDHLLLGTSLPFLLGPGMHHLQSWNEALCAGAWGRKAARWAEGLRRSQDLDHWASFQRSFTALADLIQKVASGKRGASPSSVIVLSGDVHHGYLAEATFDKPVESAVYQAVCSPFRNALPGSKKRLQRLAWTEPAAVFGRLLSRLAGVKEERIGWRLTHPEPWLENQIATLELDGGRAAITFERAVLDGSGMCGLEKVYERRLV